MSSLTILTLAIIAAANMAVGGCIGICGIAGFLLPMLYTGGLGFDVTYALALSFLAFLVSGIIGSFNYYKAGNLEVRMSLKLGIGSLIGAIAGVFLQSMIEKSTAKTILYLVVLFSGASILVRMWNEKRKADSVCLQMKVISDEKNSASSNPVPSKIYCRPYGIPDFPRNHNRSDLFSLRCRRPGTCDASSGSMRSVRKDCRRCGTF